MNQHEKYIQRCMDLAQRGNGFVAPNPLVGAVLVYDNKIIGEGWHQQFGKAHAEVNCLNSVADENKKFIDSSTLYVSLEPCNHFGKTPPCTDLIIENGIKKVVIGCRDENEMVNGVGVKRLSAHGVEVIENVLETECRKLNKRFFTFYKKHRPYIFLKWAETADGFIAGENFQQIKISNSPIDFLMHEMRSSEAAIMVGFNTALHDNPKLTARNFSNAKQPLRIVIDKRNELPISHFLLTDEFPTLILNENKNEKNSNKEFLKIDFSENWMHDFMQILFERKIISLIVEGGTQLLQTFIQSNLWDESVRIKNYELRIMNGIAAPKFSIDFSKKETIRNNEIEIYFNSINQISAQ
jgi:diaminohydroxyphosphoribosylaminopyrimidine deaminase / 5-amino-6-(5-phosphoribosylamino)uracil reductase